MSGKPITKVAWDDLPGKWLAISTSSGGCLGLIIATLQDKMFRQLIACPYIMKSAAEIRVFRSERIICISEPQNGEKTFYEVYDTVDDMRDDVMVALLKHDGINRPSIALILELEEYRERFGITEWISRAGHGPRPMHDSLGMP